MCLVAWFAGISVCAYFTHEASDKFIQVFLIHYVCDLFPFIQIILITRYCAFLWLMLVHLLSLAHRFLPISMYTLLNGFGSKWCISFFSILSCVFFSLFFEYVWRKKNNFQLLHENSIKLTNHRLLTQKPMKITIGHPLWTLTRLHSNFRILFFHVNCYFFNMKLLGCRD